MLYVEIIHLLTAECKREVLAQQSIYLMAQIIHSLENGCTVWTLYEVFIQADDPAVDEAHREHLFMRYRDPNINRPFFQKVPFLISVCYIIVKNPLMRTSTNFFLFNLAIADVFILCVGKSIYLNSLSKLFSYFHKRPILLHFKVISWFVQHYNSCHICTANKFCTLENKMWVLGSIM